MDVIQKLTLYDLLGYTVPGTILIVIIGICHIDSELFVCEDFKAYIGYIAVLVIMFGYVVGIIVSEITSKIFGTIYKYFTFLNKNSEIDNIGCDVITQALINEGVLKNNQAILSKENIKNYYRYMYAVIQMDSSCVRIHNYASSELVCRNLIMVLLLSLFMLRKYREEWINANVVLWGIIGAFFLFLRYVKQKNAKEAYMLDWFVQKYK